MDYEKILSDLRNADSFTADHRLLGICVRAANAIEELQKMLEAVQKNSEINFKMWEQAQAEVDQLKAEFIDCVCNGDLD